MMLEHSAPYVAILAILITVLAMRVSVVRARTQILWGEGSPPNETLQRARRAHNTVMEFSVPFLTVLVAYDLVGGNGTWIMWLAIAFIVGRVLHAFGMYFLGPMNVGRASGAALSSLSTLAVAILLLVKMWG
jgi:uncharacterized protein